MHAHTTNYVCSAAKQMSKRLCCCLHFQWLMPRSLKSGATDVTRSKTFALDAGIKIESRKMEIFTSVWRTWGKKSYVAPCGVWILFRQQQLSARERQNRCAINLLDLSRRLFSFVARSHHAAVCLRSYWAPNYFPTFARRTAFGLLNWRKPLIVVDEVFFFKPREIFQLKMG